MLVAVHVEVVVKMGEVRSWSEYVLVVCAGSDSGAGGAWLTGSEHDEAVAVAGAGAGAGGAGLIRHKCFIIYYTC